MALSQENNLKKPLKKYSEETLCDFFTRVMDEHNFNSNTFQQKTGLSQETVRKLLCDTRYIPRTEYIFELIYVVFNFTATEAEYFRRVYIAESIKNFYKTSFPKKRKELEETYVLENIRIKRQCEINKLLKNNPYLSINRIADSVIFYKRFSTKTIARDIRELGFINIGSRKKPFWLKKD